MNAQRNRVAHKQLSLNITKGLLKCHEMGRAQFISQHGHRAYQEKKAHLEKIIKEKEERLHKPFTIPKDSQWLDLYQTINEPSFNHKMTKYGLDFEMMMSTLATLAKEPNTQ